MENKIIKCENIQEVEQLHPTVMFREDMYLDNRFFVSKYEDITIGFSYYELGIEPYVIQIRNVVFFGFGQSIYIYDYDAGIELYKCTDPSLVIYEVIDMNEKHSVLYIGERYLGCFDYSGRLLWENTYREFILNWNIDKNIITVDLEGEYQLLVDLSNGNGKTVHYNSAII